MSKHHPIPAPRAGTLRLLRGLAPRAPTPCVLTIGSFDGLHVGHQALIGRALTRAGELALPAGLLSFEPMPREVLQPAAPPARLTNFRERWRLLQDSGLDRFHLLAFNQRLRSMPRRNVLKPWSERTINRVSLPVHFFMVRPTRLSIRWYKSSIARR